MTSGDPYSERARGSHTIDMVLFLVLIVAVFAAAGYAALRTRPEPPPPPSDDPAIGTSQWGGGPTAGS